MMSSVDQNGSELLHIEVCQKIDSVVDRETIIQGLKLYFYKYSRIKKRIVRYPL